MSFNQSINQMKNPLFGQQVVQVNKQGEQKIPTGTKFAASMSVNNTSQDVYFGAQNKSNRPSMLRRFLYTALATAGLATVALPGVAAAETEAPLQPTNTGCDASSATTGNGSVNLDWDGYITGLPEEVNSSQFQRVFRADDSMITDEVCREIAAQFNELYTDRKGDFVLMEIADTDMRDFDFEDLAKAIFDEMQFGAEDRDDGLLILAVNNRFENGESDKFIVVPGQDVDSDSFWLDDENAWFSHLDPVLDEFSWLMTEGETEAAMALLNESLANYTGDLAEGRSELIDGQRAAAALAKDAGKVGVVVLVLGGVATPIIIVRKKRNNKLDNSIDNVQQSLKYLNPGYDLTRDNVHSTQTLSELLDPYASKANEVNTSQLISSINTVVANLEEGDYDTVQYLLLDKGIQHPQPAIRVEAMELLVETGEIDASEFDILMDALTVEEDANVIQAMHETVVDMAEKEDVPKFNIYLQQTDSVAMQVLCLDVLAKYPDNDTLGQFFVLKEQPFLKPELSEKLDEVLQKLITNMSQGTQESQALVAELKTHLNSKNLQVQELALKGLATIAEPESYQDIYNAFVENVAPQQLPYFEQALKATVTKNSIAALHSGLSVEALAESSKDIQTMNLKLLAQLKDSSAVKPILDYLKDPNTPSPEAAIEAFVACVDSTHQQQMVDLLLSDAPETEESDLMMAVAKGLEKLGDQTVDINAYIQALDNKNLSLDTITALEKGMFMAASDRGVNDFETLVVQLESNPFEKSRLAVVRALAQIFGVKALAPLFNSLANPNGVSDTEKTLVRKNILEIVANDTRKPTVEVLLENLNKGGEATDIAVAGLKVVMNDWSEKHSYDDGYVQTNLAQLAASTNADVSNYAQAISVKMVDKKVKEIQTLGANGSFSISSDDYTSVHHYENNDKNHKIRQAAETARKQMDNRRSAYEKAEAARKAKLAERRARQRARALERELERERNRPTIIVTNDRSSRGRSRNSGGGGSVWNTPSAPSRPKRTTTQRKSTTTTRRRGGSSSNSSRRSSSSRRGGKRGGRTKRR